METDNFSTKRTGCARIEYKNFEKLPQIPARFEIKFPGYMTKFQKVSLEPDDAQFLIRKREQILQSLESKTIKQGL